MNDGVRIIYSGEKDCGPPPVSIIEIKEIKLGQGDQGDVLPGVQGVFVIVCGSRKVLPPPLASWTAGLHKKLQMTSVGRTLRRVERHVCQFCHGVREDHDNAPERVTASSRAFDNLLEKRAEKTKT